MTTYTITQDQLDLLTGVLERAGTTDDSEYKWDTHSKAKKMLQSLQPNTQEPARYVWYQLFDMDNGPAWVEVCEKYDPRSPECSELHKSVNWSDAAQVRGFTALFTHQAPQQPAKTNWSELVQWWESGGEQWDVLQNIVTRMVNTAAPQQKPLVCGLCGEERSFTGSCGGGQSNPKALCYTHPAPQAKSLTDDQITEMAKPFINTVGDYWCNENAIRDNGNVEAFARAIEAAHNIKGK